MYVRSYVYTHMLGTHKYFIGINVVIVVINCTHVHIALTTM